MRFIASTAFWQVAACVTGAAACAFPCDVIHRGFWDYHFSVMRSDTKGKRIEEIQPNTPAAALQEKDRIVAINGREDAVYDIHKAWREAPVGSEVEFRVLRGEPLTGDNALPPHPIVITKDVKPRTADEVVVRVPRVADPVAAKVYWHWQLPAVLTFLGLGILAAVTRPSHSTSGWGGFLLSAGAVTLLVVLLLINWTFRLLPASQRIAWNEHYSYVDPFPWQKAVAVGVCAALALLGAVGFLTAVRRRESLQATEPGAAADGGS